MIISELAPKAHSQNKNKWAKTQVPSLQTVYVYLQFRQMRSLFISVAQFTRLCDNLQKTTRGWQNFPRAVCSASRFYLTKKILSALKRNKLAHSLLQYTPSSLHRLKFWFILVHKGEITGSEDRQETASEFWNTSSRSCKEINLKSASPQQLLFRVYISQNYALCNIVTELVSWYRRKLVNNTCYRPLVNCTEMLLTLEYRWGSRILNFNRTAAELSFNRTAADPFEGQGEASQQSWKNRQFVWDTRVLLLSGWTWASLVPLNLI